MRGNSYTASIVATLLLLLVVCSACRTAAGAYDLETVSPEEVGWSSERLRELARHADRLGYSALVLAHDGKVFFSWGNVDRNYKCHSIRKPFLSALYGIYVGEGTVDLDLTMNDLGIDDIPPRLTAAEKTATVKQLLQGRSGIYHEAAAENSVNGDVSQTRVSGTGITPAQAAKVSPKPPFGTRPRNLGGDRMPSRRDSMTTERVWYVPRPVTIAADLGGV